MTEGLIIGSVLLIGGLVVRYMQTHPFYRYKTQKHKEHYQSKLHDALEHRSDSTGAYWLSRAIADFIFGNNKAPGQSASAKIAMTAPVTVQPRANDNSLREARDWRIQFVMPSQYTMETLPKPNNQAVQLREVPTQRFAVLRYSGLNSESKVEDKTNELLAWVKSKNWQMLGSPQLSRYDPPWTLPMWRRNEIRVEVTAP